MASSSSTQNHHHNHNHLSAPPPTPSNNLTSTYPSDSAATDLLSRLLHRLPPNLSNTSPILLRRRSPPIIPFSDLNSSLSSNLTSISELGFFQLTNHPIPSKLAHSAHSDSLSVFNLTHHQKHQHFPNTWPFGFDDDDEESLFIDSSFSTDSDEFSVSSLVELTREMEKIGSAVVEALTCAMGLQNPDTSVCSLMCIGSGKFYPYVVGLHYQIQSSQNCSLLTDSGSVTISPQMDSILVTLGDIAQVWSNGKIKKVRGEASTSTEEDKKSEIESLLMSVLVTLPLESSIVSPLLRVVNDDNQNENENEDENKFNSFSFQDYAWRVYHQRFPLKDPLDRYRIHT